MYQRRPPARFGNQTTDSPESTLGATPVSKPLKRPSQARAKFTVQAIYDAFVRIWQSKGWDGITTRAVALETGIAVGTLYDYFPNKQSLLSGYVRHCIDVLLEAIEQQVIQAPGLHWPQRVQRLVRLTCGMDVAELPYFDSDMLLLEHRIAEPKHHRRVYEEMSAQWQKSFDACTGLPQRPDAATVKALFLAVWGARRYLLLVQPQDIDAQTWVAEMERLCNAVLLPAAQP